MNACASCVLIVGEEFFGPEYVRGSTVNGWAQAAGLRRIERAPGQRLGVSAHIPAR
ncbi:hypothetical protein [Deinococcus arenicola]|uniref:Uncharacterized protein n=1 Tax=Deinococcus arenicola TaxID=2994950 RepID=A0ABU4DUF7_9DEIO|nr:hypothetical protein [Deinococcus sp. ZS9-10]MDV6375607.1 hypothetical protein [Deinococcus sp. ZS9-10]